MQFCLEQNHYKMCLFVKYELKLIKWMSTFASKSFNFGARGLKKCKNWEIWDQLLGVKHTQGMGWMRISKHKLIFLSKYCEFHDFLNFSSKRNSSHRKNNCKNIILDLGCICVLWRVVFVCILMHVIPLLMQKSN